MPLPIQTVPVFVSSTWLDLEPERNAVEAAIQRLRETKFVGMEYFGSRDETTRRASLDEVDRSKIYVGLFAARYGSGITEEEYRRARSLGLPCLIYFKSDTVALAPDQQETDADKSARLAALKRELRGAHTVKQFKNPDDLAAQLATDLHRWLFDEYLTPMLERAARGELPFPQAQALLSSIRDKSALNPTLLTQLTARHQLRAPVGDFVGREKEIADLLTTLRGGKSAAITGISGMGGIGKTELAYYVANLLRDAYPDAQLVLDMRGTDERPRDPADALASCIRAFLGLEQRLPDDTEELTRLYRSVLEGKRALILLDNALDGAQVRPLLPPAGSTLLVTSRNAVALPRMQRVTLEQLEPLEARELLRGIVMRGNTSRIPEDTADRICFLCGYLPLAIRAAGSLLDVTADLDPEVYAAQLEDERRRLELIGTEGVDISVEASFGLSYARLTPDAARVFRQLAIFPATFDAAAEETVCEDENHKHLSDLLRRSLVLFNADTRRYNLHDLTRLFADSRLSAEARSTGQKQHAAHYLHVLRECDELYLQGDDALRRGLALFDLEWHNIQSGFSWAEERVEIIDKAAELCDAFPEAGAYLILLRLHPREIIRWNESALSAARRLGDRASEAGHIGNLGLAYMRLGELDTAVRYFKDHLIIAREIGDRVGELRDLDHLGLAYSFSGKTDRAIEFHKQALTIAREIGYRRGEGNALANLGTAYLHANELQQAIEHYEQGLTIFRETGNKYGEGSALGNIGIAYLRLDDPQRCVDFCRQQFIFASDIGDLEGKGNALFNMALALNTLGDHAQAIAHAEAALEICEQIESPNAETARELLAQWRGEATKGERGFIILRALRRLNLWRKK